jgi:exonuclease VII small subunit
MSDKRATASRTESDPDEIPVSQLSYTDASNELDEIVEFFEHRDVDVDQLVARLERATSIVDELDRRVRRTRSQVEQLVPRLQATARGDSDEITTDDDLEGDDFEDSEEGEIPTNVEPELFS